MTYDPHYCTVCDVDAGHGLGPPARPVLTWYCREHRPAGFFGVPAKREAPKAAAPSGDLFGERAA